MSLLNRILLWLVKHWPRFFMLQCKFCGEIVDMNRAEQHMVICHAGEFESEGED